MPDEAIPAEAEKLLAVVSRRREESVVGENDRMVARRGVRERHGHARRLGGDDERAKVVVESPDLGFGRRLAGGLSLRFGQADA